MTNFLLPSVNAIVHPAAERTDTETINGVEVHFCAYGWSTSRSWGHDAYCPELGIKNRIRYYNRTWEAHRFDMVIAGLRHKARLVLDPAYAANDKAEQNRRRREAAKARKAARAEADAKQARLAL